ncbi:hypothetical protein GDO81_024251 [Engystomops pustulosus]|uniref:Uncharacterized protein n=1 Tax=Engystomops pustulosus TaxID=76066 RepID=A0AAV6YUB8_ENGPU|nr:hypothetical protein GDO81_024251 [Engystomops pustulosus]
MYSGCSARKSCSRVPVQFLCSHTDTHSRYTGSRSPREASATPARSNTSSGAMTGEPALPPLKLLPKYVRCQNRPPATERGEKVPAAHSHCCLYRWIHSTTKE